MTDEPCETEDAQAVPANTTEAPEIEAIPEDAPLFPRWVWWVLGVLVGLTVIYLLLRVPNPALPPIEPVTP